MKRFAALLLLVWPASLVSGSEQTAVYRAVGADTGLFDQYDNDGYSLAVSALPDGSLALKVRVSDAFLATAAPFPKGFRRDASALPEAPERDLFAQKLTRGARTEEEAVRRVLVGLRSNLAYDPDRLRRQDPGAVFSSRRAYCVGFAELAVDLLRRVGVSARTVQGILRTDPGSDHYDPAIGGAYHRWIEVHYPDRGYVFSDPWASINGVDARYIPFARRSLVKPRALELEVLEPLSGRLSYGSIPAGEANLRLRSSEPTGARP